MLNGDDACSEWSWYRTANHTFEITKYYGMAYNSICHTSNKWKTGKRRLIATNSVKLFSLHVNWSHNSDRACINRNSCARIPCIIFIYFFYLEVRNSVYSKKHHSERGELAAFFCFSPLFSFSRHIFHRCYRYVPFKVPCSVCVSIPCEWSEIEIIVASLYCNLCPCVHLHWYARCAERLICKILGDLHLYAKICLFNSRQKTLWNHAHA